ncbi:D-glucuronyl C5-epimerase family protein [Glycomyces buryatensis]|uniref:D-glucuronyl C5-epimerase C-terminal domain-containing protein n=1 Tax=Glycomyces buryatensis TaxID=2570927 RepID=A0A4V4HSX8_9ACTN|nr:D-glucuronyl C5-epimerase family protein [Glycomyces buryatensis]THV43396.1 hypothetical protein FAB82_01610 [Glycomyces buryatensis]
MAIAAATESALRRMDEHEGALVFWYEAGIGARLFERHYSALTQSYYARLLWEAVGDGEAMAAARRCFAALAVPAERGDVLFRDANGVSIAEVPQRPNSYLLNGWLSALVSAWDYYECSGNAAARELVESSAQSLAGLLHRYDAEPEKNNRYGLTCFTYLKTPAARIEDATVIVPGEGAFGLTGHGSHWANHRMSDARIVNLVFYLASPEPNTVRLNVARPTPVELRLGHRGRGATVEFRVAPSRPTGAVR